jgi:DUF1365 family protein
VTAPAAGTAAALFECEIVHTRTSPLHNQFRYLSYLWLVDLNHLPRPAGPLRLLAGFRAGDHLGGPAVDGVPRSIRQNLDTYLATEGIDLAGGQVLMLTAARVLGYVFNPLTVYWCHDRAGALVCVVAEVHNTYGERHCYLVRTDERGRAEVEKDFYVSPFEPAGGAMYRMSLPEPGEALDLTITLHRPGAAPFVTGVRGRRRAATTAALLRLGLRYPLAPLMVTVRIRRQGIRLFFRGLRIVRRPDHEKQEAVQ